MAAAVEKKAAELVDDVAAQEKLVELGEQALTAIRDAKTQDAVDKALQAALTSINQLQATPKEEVKHSNLPTEGDKVLIQTQPSLEVTTESIAFNTVRRENAFLAKGKEQVVSEGKVGQVTTYVEVDGDTRKTVKVEREEAQDRVIEVGTFEGTSVPGEGVKELNFSQPSLEVVEEALSFKIVKQDDPTLSEGETRVAQAGREGKERVSIEVALDGSRTEKLREVVEEPQDEIVLVGTKKVESGKTDPAIHEVPEFTGSVNSSEAASHELPEFTGGVTGSEAVIREEDPEFTGGVNGTEAASHELPEFTGGVNGAEAAIHEAPEFTGNVNGVEAAITEVPEFTGGVNGEEVAIRGEAPEFTGNVNGVEAAMNEVPEFTGGVNGEEVAIRGEAPEFTGGVNGVEAASHELPEFTGGVNGEEVAIRGEAPEFTGGVNGVEAASHGLPEFTGGVNGAEATVSEVPEFTGGVNGVEAASHGLPEFTDGVNGAEATVSEVPEFTGGVNGAEATVHEIPEYKDMQSLVASQDKLNQAPANRQDILPETGAKETATLASLGAVGALLGLAAMGKKKEDE
ncbi:LPXTG cell wall anchor domain-containing protein [Streptococcus mitis]|uniref:LPXTG cell wall anchor domain-containing protein n=1 Tax=Streptococcus mitis TaxID=28037 RepID=A0A7X1RMT3_STRMT|nr:LPXTG cell wall anchor domain-containing protein [Streptococcus mitis]